MSLIQVLYAPGRVFAELRENGWMLPMLASILVSVLSAVLLVNAMGAEGILRAGSKANAGVTDGNLGVQISLGIAFGSMLNVFRTVTIASAISLLLRLNRQQMAFGLILATCCYAEYIYELCDLMVKGVAVLYHYVLRIPLTDASSIRTDATILLNKAIVAGRLHALAQSLDLLTIGFFIFVGFGLWRLIPKASLLRAEVIAMTPWVVWVIAKIAMAVNSPTGLSGN